MSKTPHHQRYAARCLAAIGPQNHETARRFLEWKANDGGSPSTVSQYASLLRELDHRYAQPFVELHPEPLMDS